MASAYRLRMELPLYNSPDLLTIGQLANYVNTKLNEDRVYFIENMTIYHTNVCEAHCRFCGFRRYPVRKELIPTPGMSWLNRSRQKITPTTRELHMTGGHNPEQPFEYYVDIVRKLKQAFPHVALKMFTPSEIDFYARISRIVYAGSVEDTN